MLQYIMRLHALHQLFLLAYLTNIKTFLTSRLACSNTAIRCLSSRRWTRWCL